MHNQYETFAIAWVPRNGTELEVFGSGWTGWSAEAGARHPVPPQFLASQNRDGVPGATAKLGIHASVKSPFRLAGGRSVWALERALQELAERTAAIRLPRLELTVFDKQVVLSLSRPSNAVTRLLADVADLVRLYQVLPDYAGLADNSAPLPPSRDWGAVTMPVLERFHVPLTDRLDLGTAYDVVAELDQVLAPILAVPQLLSDLALVGDPGGNRPWRVIERYELREAPVRARPDSPATMSCLGPHLIAPLGEIAKDGSKQITA